MKIKNLILLCSVVITLSGCATASGTREVKSPDGTTTLESVKLSSVFSKGAIAKFKGAYSTKTTSGLVTFDSGETEAQQIEQFGAAFGAAAASAMKKAVVP